MRSEKEEQQDLVIVGTSPEGIEALPSLISTLTSEFPAPIILALPFELNRSDNLVSMLQRRTPLTVEMVHANSVLKKGCIYLVPVNQGVDIGKGTVGVYEDTSKQLKPSLDRLLNAAARLYEEHLIVVLLANSGSEGISGIAEVKNTGGIVVVQDPQTFPHLSKSLTLPPSLIDFEVGIERIWPLITALLNGTSNSANEERTENVLPHVLDLVSRQASIDFQLYKPSTILRRIGRRMIATHTHLMSDYYEYLLTHPEEVGELVQAFLINVTQFFRDAEAFSFLKSEILPKIIDRARERNQVLRFWTAGCATGEEPYSLAMLVVDLLGAELPEWSVKIFATDVDEAAIDFARRGVYADNLLKFMSEEYRERFFEPAEQGCRISKTLRQMAIFGLQDLSRSAPFPRIDLVLCRNVLIYFSPELQDYVLDQFAFSLSPNSYLFLGKAETIRPNQSFYELLDKRWKIYRCTGKALPLVRGQHSTQVEVVRMEDRPFHSPRSIRKQPFDQDISQPSLELSQLRRLNELLLRFLSIGVAVIDRSYHVLTTNGSARRLLGLRDTNNEQDFLHSVRGIPYERVRAAIDSVFREASSITLPEVELDVNTGGNGCFINFTIALMRMDAGIPDLAVISVTDVTDQVQIRRQLEMIQVEQTQLTDELSSANRRLNDMNKELLDTNEELQVTNKELLLTQEELQATIEEFETTNEELQATNEELETNNEELQATNEELETTNEELRARTSELQELASMLDIERNRLADMIEQSPFYIMVLRGKNLFVEAFNPRYSRLVKMEKVIGRPLEDVSHFFWEEKTQVSKIAYQVYLKGIPVVTPRLLTHVTNEKGELEERYLVYNIVPVLEREMLGSVSGVVIYALDETEQEKNSSQGELEKLKVLLANINQGIMALYERGSGNLLLASDTYLDLLATLEDIPKEHLRERKWYDLVSLFRDDRLTQVWDQMGESKKPLFVHNVSLPGRDGAETLWDYQLDPLMDSNQKNDVRYILLSVSRAGREDV